MNLDRFTLFFPEKRPFFLENAGFFSVGNPGEVDLFFSRRIGIGAGGEEIPILGGGRVSGKVGRATSACSNMQTDDSGPDAVATTSACVRVSRELPNRSAIGGIFVNRHGTGDLARDDDHNRTYAVDGKWGIGRNTLLSSFVARTDTPGVESGLRLQRPLAHLVPEVGPRRGLSGSRRPLQSGGRLSQPARLSQAGRPGDDAVPAEGLPQPAGGPAARVVPRLLGPRRLPGNRLRPPRQPLAVQRQHRGAHRHEPHARRACGRRSRSTRASSCRPAPTTTRRRSWSS